jgi:hypothetical protein
MVISINILILLGIIILLFIPAIKTIQVKNYSLMLSFIVFIGSLSFLKIPLAVSIYTETISITLLSLPLFVFAWSYMLDGLSSSRYFYVSFLYDRYHSRNIFYYRGLVTILPFFCFFFFVFNLANLGFPSTVNFLAEMLIFFFGFFPSYLTSFWVFPLETWFINFEDFTILSFQMFFIYTKAKFPYIFELLHRYSVFVQTIYDRICLFILNTKFKPLLLLWYKFLFYFRASCYHIHTYLGEQNFLGLIIILSIILSKYYLNGLLFIFFFVLRLEFAVLRMSKFYKNNPILFISHFEHRRFMHRVAGTIIEGALTL